VYYIIEEQFATSIERICVALFDFDSDLTSAREVKLTVKLR